MEGALMLLIIYLCVAIFVSFVCSILEAVLLSITPSFVSVQKQAGVGYATALEKLKEDVDQPLIAILTLNTIAHTMGSVGVGTQAVELYPEGHYMVTAVIPAVMTFLILVASEIIPKTIGATYWKQLAGISTRVLNWILVPLKYTGILFLLTLTTKLVGKSGHSSYFSRADFSAMAEIGAQQGVFKDGESKIIGNLLRFDKVAVQSVMTPHIVVKRAFADTKIKDFYAENGNLTFSRIPIYTNVNDISTYRYILKDDLLTAMIEGEGEGKLSDLNPHNIKIVGTTTSITNLYRDFTLNNEHVALVVGEYGSLAGLVSMEDVIETLLGLEIVDELDDIDDLQLKARRAWEERAKRLGLARNKT